MPSGEIFREEPAEVDFGTASWARRYQTALRKGTSAGANFAGHYALVSWGCGTACQQSAIVDVITGRIYPGPMSSSGYGFRLDSRLLVVNPADLSRPDSLLSEEERPQNWLWRTGGVIRLE